MGKYGKYKKTYKTEWESLSIFKNWLQKSEHGEAYCRVCKTTLRPHKTDLERHARRQMHKRNFNKHIPDKKQSLLPAISIITNDTKKTELKLAVFTGIHCAVKAVDHLSELTQHLLNENENNHKVNIRLHRTKCSMLIKNCIAPCLLAELIDDLGNNPYSLIIDESTDVAVCKYLCLCIRYFSKSQEVIKTDYLGLIEVDRTTAVILSTSIKLFLSKIGLKQVNCYGIGTDGANNLCGHHNSVFTILKKEIPDLQLIKCVAHSLHLCTSKAAKVLPSNLDFMCKEIYNFFSLSPIRRSDYYKFFSTVNINENKNFRRFVQLSETRWLARANVFKVIKEQWVELTGYLRTFIANEKHYTAKVLYEMLSDNQNYIYFAILYPILMSINAINGLFQKDSTDIFKSYEELYRLVLRFLRVIIKPIFLSELQDMNEPNLKSIAEILDNELAYINIEILDFGYSFREALSQYHTNTDCLRDIKVRCRDFLKVVCYEICNRMPHNLEIVGALKWFSPEMCLKTHGRPTVETLFPAQGLKHEDYVLLEEQWENLVLIKWETSETETTESFWIKAFKYKNSGGISIFEKLALLVLKMLILPVSNAPVERIFSVLNVVKTKIRNKISFSLLDALLRLRIRLKTENKCCNNFEPSKKMYELFNQNMYDHIKANESDSNSQEQLLINNVLDIFEEDDDMCLT